ncbi:carbohydrate kinase family protein, partial [bacterium]|nr:carbohydrate kinase family protein [bacterium]
KKHFKNIDLTGVKTHLKDFTASAYIITDKSNNQITGFHPGAMRYHTSKPKFKKDDLVIISPANPNEMLDMAETCFKKNIPFIFDPGQQIIQFTKTQLKRVIKQSSIYIVNDYELALTVKLTGYSKDIILQKAGILITTLGRKGSLIQVRDGKKVITYKIAPAKIKKVVDPTGAGDAFRSGLIKGLVDNKKYFLKKEYVKMPWLEIGQLASLTAVYALESYGTQNHKYTLNNLKKRYKLNYKT